MLCVVQRYGAQAPTPTIQVKSAVVCSGSTVTLTALQGTVAPVSMGWSINPMQGVSIISGANDASLVVRFNNAGPYSITYRWTFDALGSASRNIGLNVIKTAESAFNASLSASGYPNQLFLSDFSKHSVKVHWVFDGVFPVTDSLPTTSKVYANAGTYTVMNIAFGNQGCNDTSYYRFSLVESSDLVLPNVFTPNHDGTNDVYRPTGKGISELHVQIYNRLGILVHEWDTVNGCWDGYTTSGLLCDAGTYMVIAEGKGFDGKTYSLRTTLSLMR